MTFALPEGNKYFVCLVDGACCTTSIKPELATHAIAELAKGGSRGWALSGPGDLAELTSAETLAIRNGYQTKPVKTFPNNEKNREALFAMVLNGSIDDPVPADQAPASGTSQNPPAPSKQKEAPVMATKKKAAKKKAVKKSATPRVAAPLTIEVSGNAAPPKGTTCGCYIRSLVMAGKGTEDILKLVHKHFPDTTAKGSDVSWNRKKLKDAGKKVPDARKAAEA